jgi:hypothetical protein
VGERFPDLWKDVPPVVNKTFYCNGLMPDYLLFLVAKQGEEEAKGSDFLSSLKQAGDIGIVEECREIV